MSRRVVRSLALGLVLSMLVAVPSLAVSPFRFKELRDVCQLGGGAHGFGYMIFKVRVKELGTSGANYFRVSSRVQYKGPNGGSWKTLRDWGWTYSTDFPDDSANYYHDKQRRFDPDGTPDASAHRMWMRVQVWSSSTGLLASKVMTGQKCVTGLP